MTNYKGRSKIWKNVNVADAKKKNANANAVTINRCPFCNCDPCDCDWGISELFKDWNASGNKTLVKGLLSNNTGSAFEDLRIPVFDSLYNSLGTGVPNVYGKHYQSVVVDRSIYKIGDLVHWHPFYGFCDFKKPWIIKTVFSTDPLDCSYHDYEITDGMESHLVTFNEIRKLEDK